MITQVLEGNLRVIEGITDAGVPVKIIEVSDPLHITRIPLPPDAARTVAAALVGVEIVRGLPPEMN